MISIENNKFVLLNKQIFNELVKYIENYLNKNSSSLNKTKSSAERNEPHSADSNFSQFDEKISTIKIDSIHPDASSYNESAFVDQEFFNKKFDNSNKELSQKMVSKCETSIASQSNKQSRHYPNGDVFHGKILEETT